jgi:drug/metabolite transporter (DMT)-like permease
MSRTSWILFLTPVLIWSTTFYAITLQLGSVTTPTYAVALRFGCAAALLFVWMAVRGESTSLPTGMHGLTALSGICSYGISYVLTYVAEETIPSGLVAIAFTLMVFLTPALSRVTHGSSMTRRTWLGGSLGVLGVALCFLPDLLTVDVSSAFVTGMAAMAVAALVSSIGAVCSMHLNSQNVPVVAYTAWAMTYGASASLVYGALSGQTFSLDARPSFWAAFAYLTIPGTIVTFLSYLTLLKREGSARTMYISVMAPIGAVIVSILWEDFRPQALTFLGIVAALAGAWVTLTSKAD